MSGIVRVMGSGGPASGAQRPADVSDPGDGGFAALFVRERLPMTRLATLLVGSLAVAEELVQDAFLALDQRWSTVENPRAYLRASVVNACRMAVRRRQIEQRYAIPERLSIDAPVELVELQEALAVLSERERARDRPAIPGRCT